MIPPLPVGVSTSFCLLTTVSWWNSPVGGSHIISHQSHFSQFLEGELMWLQRTDTSTSSCMLWCQSKSLRQSRCSARAPWRGRAHGGTGQCQAPGCQDWTRSKHQAGQALPLLGACVGKAGIPTPSCATCMASYPYSISSRLIQGWQKPSLGRGMRQGTTQPVHYLLSMPFL